MFTRAEISTVQTIASRPPPGTAVVVTASTKLKDICVYLDQGLVSMEQVNILFAGFVDDEADASKRKALMDKSPPRGKWCWPAAPAKTGPYEGP